MDDGKFSLITVLAYYKNFVINAKEMFDSLDVESIVDPPTTKKGKEIDIKNIVVKSGTIISAKNGNRIKGIDPKPSGQYNFHVKTANGLVKIYTDTYDNVGLYHKKGKIIEMEKLSIKTKPFPNQITVNYSYKPGQNINMFIFRKSIKISGFQSEKYAIKMIKKLWQVFLAAGPAAITFFPLGNPSFIFESSMTNSTFRTAYNFSLTGVNTLIHRLKETCQDSLIINSDFEPTIDNGVKITLKAIKPEDYAFNEIIWNGHEFEDSSCIVISGRNKSADLEKKSTISLYSEKFVISTRYGAIMEKTRKYLTDILDNYREELEIVKIDKIKRYKLRIK